MSNPDALFHLAQLAGIARDYWDIHGQRFETSQETARLLLDALGIAADSPSEIAASTILLEEEAWRTSLPPVAVVRGHAAVSIPVNVPADSAPRTWRWRLELETGNILSGDTSTEAMSLLSVREIGGGRVERRLLPLPQLPLGYHTLSVEEGETRSKMSLIGTPLQCYLPPTLAKGGRVWGMAAQLYSLRSAHNWGIGDFGDLRALIELGREHGADLVGFNPLHALFPERPAEASPYAPSSRLFLNPLYIDVAAMPDATASPSIQQTLHSSIFTRDLTRAQAAELVDYPAAAALKLRVLEQTFAHFRQNHLTRATDPRTIAFKQFQNDRGEALRRFAIFQTLCETLGTSDWTNWPTPIRNAEPGTLDSLARQHEDRVTYFEYLQWQADLQLAEARRCTRQAGMAIGLYGDLALSIAANGADHWNTQATFAGNARVGAPPDPFAETGQEWGIVPMNPRGLRDTAYRDFIATLRANMRHAGALRIDHAMGLQRLFLVPRGLPPSAGTYVSYPFDDLLGIVALESQRHKCLVVGEDLGTVPEGFRARMAEAKALSYRVLYFEKENDRFRRPSEYPALAAACVATHDLATLKGFWEGIDLEDKRQAGMLSEHAFDSAQKSRAVERRALLVALAAEALLPDGIDPDTADRVVMTPELVAAVHGYLARSPAAIMMAQLDDLAGELHQVNLPGTSKDHDWRRRLSPNIESLTNDETLCRVTVGIARERPLASHDSNTMGH